MDDSSDEEQENDDNDDTASVLSEARDPSDADMESTRYLSCQAEAEDSMSDKPAPQHTPRCWMCTFAPHPVATLMHEFVASNVATMDLHYIASQIKDEIKSKFPHASGARKRDIMRHIAEHMINPHVKIASTIRSLVTVAETLKAGLTHRDSDTNEVLVDIKNTELYLKVVAQIVAAYKLDSTKLLFGRPTT
jgi:hypothetical protein